MKIVMKLKITFGILLTVAFIFAALTVYFRSIAHHTSVHNELGSPIFFYVIGAAIYFAPVELLLRFDRRTGFSLFKLAGGGDAGLKIAGTFFTVFGLIFMLFPSALIFAALLVECPPNICPG